jgi:hypothetical protein
LGHANFIVFRQRRHGFAIGVPLGRLNEPWAACFSLGLISLTLAKN